MSTESKFLTDFLDKIPFSFDVDNKNAVCQMECKTEKQDMSIQDNHGSSFVRRNCSVVWHYANSVWFDAIQSQNPVCV